MAENKPPQKTPQPPKPEAGPPPSNKGRDDGGKGAHGKPSDGADPVSPPGGGGIKPGGPEDPD